MSTDESPKTPAAGRPKAKKTGAGPADTPGSDAGKAPAPGDARPADAEPEKKRPDPTRYGDWEKNGRCIDF